MRDHFLVGSSILLQMAVQQLVAISVFLQKMSVCASTLPSWTRSPEKQLYWIDHKPPAPLEWSCKVAMWASCISIMLVIFITLIKVLNFFLSWDSIQFLLDHSGKDWKMGWGAIRSSWYKSSYHFSQEWRTIIHFSSGSDIRTLNKLKWSHSQVSLASFHHQLKEDSLPTEPDGMVTFALVFNRIINEFLPSWKFLSISDGSLRSLSLLAVREILASFQSSFCIKQLSLDWRVRE